MIRICSTCSWTFEFTHSNRCPQCGGDTTEHDELNQYSWFIYKRKRYEDQLENIANQEQCCYTAKHTRGCLHDANCPKQTSCD